MAMQFARFWKGLEKDAYHKSDNLKKYKPTFQDMVCIEKSLRNTRLWLIKAVAENLKGLFTTPKFSDLVCQIRTL